MTADARLQAFLEQFESTLSDALTRMEATDGDAKDTAGELATHLGQLTEAVQKLKPADLAGLISAIRELRATPPHITNEVNVPPPVVHLLPAPPAPPRKETFEVIVHGRHGAADQRMTIVKSTE